MNEHISDVVRSLIPPPPWFPGTESSRLRVFDIVSCQLLNTFNVFQGEDNSRVYVSDVKVFKDHLYATDWEGVISEWKVHGPDLRHVRTIVPPLVPGNVLKASNNASFSFG